MSESLGPVSASTARLQAGVAGRYTIDRELGRGGMATVFLASDLRHNRKVAIKVLDPELAAVMGGTRFLREIETVAGLTHPHILPIHDSGDAEGLLYYVMPFIEGESLRDRLSRVRQLPLDEALHIAGDVADALDFAHERGIVHRDIKPENILLSGRDAFVADFGIARAVARATGDTLTATGMIVGTPHYMSPEQASGEREIDGRSDVYALGCVLYEALAGEPPFSGPTVQSVVAKHLAVEAPPVRALRPSVPQGVERVITRALAKSPADRYQDAGAMARELETTAGRRRHAPDQAPGVWPELPAREHLSARPALRFGIIAGVAAVVGLLLWLAVSRSGAPETPPSTSGPTTSLAVLPFDQVGAAGEDTYFADGLTEELIAAIGRIPGLRVISRTSAFAFREKRGLTLRQIADSLGVGTVLEGSVRREANRLRVIARLVDIAADSQLLVRDYERELRDVFAVQNEIAQDIAGALSVRLAGSIEPIPQTVPTNDVEAYDLYLQGRAYWNQRTVPALREAVDRFEAAIARDSGFAAAYVGLSDALTLRGLLGGASPGEMRTRALGAAERALQLDSTSGEAHAALGHALFNFYHDYSRGEVHLRRAIALDSSSTGSRLFLGILYNDIGRFDRSIELLRQALERDPLSAPIRTTLGRVYLSAGRTDEALEQLQMSTTLNPLWPFTYVMLGHALVNKGKKDEALAAFRRAASLGGVLDSAHLAYGLAVAGQRSAAERLLRTLVEQRRDLMALDASIALGYAGLGDRDEAFRWLDRQTQSHGSPAFLRLPAFASLRDDPRFARVLRELGVPP